MIIQKGWKCKDCDDEIYSNSRHDFVSCKCGNIFVDGGFDYFRAGWKTEKGTDITRTLEEMPSPYFKLEKKKRKKKITNGQNNPENRAQAPDPTSTT